MIEDEVFKQYQAEPKKLLAYGFKKRDQSYYYERNFFDNRFQAQITVTKNKVKGKVIDRDINDEYLPLHSLQTGKFVDSVRADYVSLLKEIRKRCFNRVTIYPKDPLRYWLTPANPKYYDIMHAFNATDTIIWKQSSNIKPSDIVWLYVTSPVKAIIYQCQVLEVNIPYDYQNKNLSINKVMKIRKIKTYAKNQFTFKKLMTYGIKAVLSPRHLPDKLRQDLLTAKS